MPTRELVLDANQLADEIGRILLHANDERYRAALRHAEGIARSLADELERASREWPAETIAADSASSRSY